MLSVQTNILAMNANRQLGITTSKKAKTTEKLSSGYRINRAADDAANLSISEKMRAQIRGLNMGQRNIVDGTSWVKIGDGAMEEVADMVHRITELSVKGANGTLQDEDRAAINEEIRYLKKEINRIGGSTEFNEIEIFDNSRIMMDIDGAPNDLNIYNATYDDATGDVTYGGFVYHGNRIPWNDVDPNMVTTDPNTGEQIFTAGTYTYQDANGRLLEITCEDGAKVPEITRSFDISAGNNGLIIDGTEYSWDDLVDEDMNSASSSNVHSGVWWMDYEGATIAFYFPEDLDSLEELADSVNACQKAKYKYVWQENYAGPSPEQAVDAVAAQSMQLSNALVAQLNSNNVSFTVRAGKTSGEDGIWLEDASGNKIANSFQSWADMGITSWDSGDDIQSDFTYTYCDDEGVDDTYVSFDFTLSDITSVDSVIDGLDGMVISGNNIKTNYSITAEAALDANILKVTSKGTGKITFDEEKALGRDFDNQTQDAVGTGTLELDGTSGKVVVSIDDANGNSVITMDGLQGNAKKLMVSDLDDYVNVVVQKKTAAALAGKDPQQIQLGTVNLTNIIGSSNITTSGYFDEVLTIEQDMKMTDGASGYSPGRVGMTYPASHIDFSGLGTDFTLDDLVGAGFNTTCKTCSNHYSIQFTDSATDKTTAEGYGYNVKKQGQHYTLEIDINSLKDNGVDSGEKLAEAIVSIATGDFDFHYTQYAAKDGKLLIYDNRTQSTGTTAATFDTFPYKALDVGEYSFFTSNSGRSLKVNYSYCFSDVADQVVVNMKQNNAGEYVQVTDANGDITYQKYDSTTHAGVADSDRYDLDISYEMSDGTVSTRDDVLSDYADKAIDHMLGSTTVNVNATDYTYMNLRGSENANTAIRSVFDSTVIETEHDNSIRIQCSGNIHDYLKIPRFPLNTMELGLYKVNTKTQEAAEESLDIVKGALEKLLHKRSTYGAYQNRLEHAYAIRANVEENTQAAESQIRDANMAQEMVKLSRDNILEQVGQAMLSQANQSSDMILQLLQ